MHAMLKKLALTTALTLTVAAPAFAAPTNIGGVLIDPDYVDAGENDFISQFNFTQWYTSGDQSGTADLGYGSASTIGSVLASLDGSTNPTPYYLQGVGEFYRVNALSYANGDSFVIGGGELTFAFGGIGRNADQSFDISNAWAYVYVDQGPSTDYTHPTSNSGEVAFAMDGNVWLELEFVSLSFLSGDVGDGNVSASFNITGGLAADYFDPKSLTYNASAFFAASSGLPVDLNRQYSNGGNGSAIGNTQAVPEPATLALLGAGLLGVVGFSRRKI